MTVKQHSLLASIIILVYTLAAPPCPAHGAGDMQKALPWLADTSPFVQEFDLATKTPSLVSRGAFGVGNGKVFALEGLEMPQNTLTNPVGPYYEKTEEEQFVSVSASLEIDSKAQAFTRSTLSRVAKTSIIISRENTASLELGTITFVPWGGRSIVRIITVRNTSAAIVENAALVVTAASKALIAEPFNGNSLQQNVRQKKMAIGFFDGNAMPEGADLRKKIPALAPGAIWETAHYISFSDPSIPDSTAQMVARSPRKLLEETRAGWLKWYEGLLRVISSDPKLDAFFESTFVLMKVQESDNGLIAPMGKYSGLWCRDNFGPVRLLLAAGRFAEVRRSLAYFDLATRVVGFKNRYPLNVPVGAASAKPDWQALTPQEGDDPDILVLQFYHYWRATGDTKFIKDHYGFLKRNMEGQPHTDFRLPFNGDETYQVYLMMVGGGPMKSFYTPSSGFLYATAARALSEMALATGHRQDAREFAAIAAECARKTEEYYWAEDRGYYIPYVKKDTLEPAAAPFADINLLPLWIDYDRPTEKQRRNSITTAARLTTKEFTIKSAPNCSFYTGMAPGMLIYNLKKFGHLKRAYDIFSAMMTRVISRTGEFAEAYDQNDKWVNYGSAPTVYRPWESSINAEAVLQLITGAEFDPKTDTVTFQPYMFPDMKELKLRNLFSGKYSFAVNMYQAAGGNTKVEIKNTSATPVKVVLIAEPATGGAKTAAKGKAYHSASHGRELVRYAAALRPGATIMVFSGPAPH